MGNAQKANKDKKVTTTRMGFIDKLFVGILLTIFGGIVLHAPIAVGFGTLWPEYDLIIKSWKEILLGLALVLGVWVVARQKLWAKFNTKLFWAIIAFGLLNIAMVPLFYNGFEATVAGLFINLRFLLFFVLVYVALTLYPQLYRLFVKVFLAGVAIVIGFAVLQLTVLPHDVLKYIGYNQSTIMPFMTVDENINYIRINSTLRGPNPLGAYAIIVIAMLLALWLQHTRKLTKREFWICLFLGLGGALAVWASYSRSAALGALAAVAIIILVAYGRNINKWIWITFIAIALAISGSIVALKDTQFVSQVILHEDPEEGGLTNSNDGHAESLVEGTQRMLQQPLGAGIGSTGSASLLSDEPFILENQYLYIAHESGWLGLILFVIIFWMVMRQLWRKRKHWFALGVFSSGIGLAIIGMLLPVFADDTVGIIWWGLAAIALASDLTVKSGSIKQKVTKRS